MAEISSSVSLSADVPLASNHMDIHHSLLNYAATKNFTLGSSLSSPPSPSPQFPFEVLSLVTKRKEDEEE